MPGQRLENWVLTVTPLTPVHIGSGESLEPYEYVILEDGRLYAFRPETLLSALTEKEQEGFLERAQTNMLQLRNYLKEIMEKQPGLRQHAGFSFSVTAKARTVYEERLPNPQSDASIFPFTRTGGAPYIPGSSLKGAIRTACLASVLNRRQRTVRMNDRSDRLQKEAFNYDRINEDPFSIFRVGDSQPLVDATILVIAKVVSVRTGQEQIPMMREVSRAALMKGDTPAFEHRVTVIRPPAGDRFAPTVEAVAAACRYFYNKHLEQEGRRLRSLPDATRVYEALVRQKEKLAGDEFLLRLGWGCGFYGVTVAYEMEQAPDKASCRLLEGGVPLGWARVKVQQC